MFKPLAVVCLAAAPVMADLDPVSWTKLNTSLTFSIDYAYRTDMQGPGRVATTRAWAGFDGAWEISDRVIGTLGLGSEWTWYDFTNATNLVAGTGKPFSQLVENSIRPGLLIQHDDKWGVVLGGILDFTGETDADAGKAFNFGGFVGVRKQQSKNLAWTLGVIAKTRLEDSVSFLPLIGLEWNVSPNVTLKVQGPNARIASKIDDRWTFVLDAAWQSREYRLSDTHALPSGVVRDSRYPVSAGFLWNAGEKTEVTFKLGGIVSQEFRVFDNTGVEQSSASSDATPWVFVGGTIRF